MAHRDEAALALAISHALDNPGDPAPRIARAGVFSVEIGLDAYQALFEQITGESLAEAVPAPSARRVAAG